MITMHAPHPTPDTLNSIMDFDHVIRVHADGAVTSAPGIYAPELLDGDLDSIGPEWELMDGYSGQWDYHGPEMHASEYVGGRMAEHILAAPGLYVVIAAHYTCEIGTYEAHDASSCDECDGGGTIVESWAVARILDDEVA